MFSEKPSELIAIRELAADVASKQQLKVKRSWSIPFMVVMIIFTVVIFSMAIIPTCVVVFSAASSATSDLSQKIVNSVVINLATQVTDIFSSVKSSTDVYTQNDVLRQMMSNQTTRYGTNDDLNKAALTALRASIYTEQLTCVQRFNLTGNAPVPVPPSSGKIYNLQSWFLNRFNNDFITSWCDYSNTTACFFQKDDPEKRAIDQPSLVSPFLTPAIVQKGFIAEKTNQCDKGGVWKPEAAFGVGLFTYATCGPVSAFSCGAAFSSDYVLSYIFSKISPTKNSRVFLTDNTGTLIATNLNGTLYPVIANGSAPLTFEFVKVFDYKDAVIKDIGKRLSPSGNWTELASLSFDWKQLNVTTQFDSTKLVSRSYKLWDGTDWIVATTKVSFGTLEEFYLVLGVPRKDFFGVVDQSIATGVSLSTFFTTLGVITGILVTIGVLFPLRRLTRNMDMVTKFDFSVLSSGGLEENSYFSEIQVVQKTFNLMVKAFAGAIKRNREITQRLNSSPSNSGGFLGSGITSTTPITQITSRGYLGSNITSNSLHAFGK